MALASGTANPMAQQALEEAAKKKKQQKASGISEAPQLVTGTKSNTMTARAAQVRGLTAPTQQSGNFAKALRAEVQRNEDIVKAGGVAPQPSDSMSLSQQAQRGMAMGMKVQDRDTSGNVVKDYGSTIGDTNTKSIDNFQKAQEEAFYSGGVMPSRSQYLTNQQVQYNRTPTLSKEDQGKFTLITTPDGKTKKVPVNLQFQDYLKEKHPQAVQMEDSIRKLANIKSLFEAGGNIDDATMKFLQSQGIEADPVHIGQTIAKLTKQADAYKTMNNVPGGYLEWQASKGTDVATPAMEVGATNVDVTVPTPTGETATGTTTETGGSTTTTNNTTTTTAGGTPTQGMDQSAGAQTSEGIASMGGDMFAGQPASASMSAIQAGTLGQQRMNEQIYGDTASMAMDTYGVAESARANQLRRALAGSNAVDAGINLGAMTLPQLEQLASESGLDLSQDTKDRIQAGGKAQIENMLMEKNERMQYIELDRRGIEREYGRALTEREDFNVQQDTRLRRLLGAFGGGVVQTIGGNAEVMKSLEKGVQAKEDLLSDFADKKTSIGLQAQSAIREYGYNTRVIEADMASKQEQAYGALTEKLDGLLSMGVTNKKELDTAMLSAKKEFAKEYATITKDAMTAIVAENERLFDQSIKIQEMQMKDDESLSAAYGVIFRGGTPVKDQAGNAIPTMDNMKFQSEIDYKRSQMEGIIYQGGVPMMDAQGNPVPTFDASKFYMQEERQRQSQAFDQQMGQMNYNLNVQKFNQDVQEFGANYAIKQAEEMRNADVFNMNLLEKGYTSGLVDPNTGMVVDSTGIYNKSGSKYSPIVSGDSIQFRVPTDASGALKAWSSLREQCGEFVNDALGKRGFMSDLFTDKMKKVTSTIPIIGSAFVQSVGNQYGHTGLVEKVSTNEYGVPISMSIVDSNAKGTGKIERATIDISYDQNGNATYKRGGKTVNIKGFTDSVLGSPTKQFNQLSDGRVISKNQTAEAVADKGKILPASQLTMLADAKLFPEMLNKLEQQITSGGATYDPIMGTLKSLNPYDTTQQKTNAELGRNAQLIGKFMEGGVLRKEDEAKYKKMLPNSSDTKEVALFKLQGVREMLNQKQQEYINTWKEGGYDVSNVTTSGGGQATMDDITNLLNNL